MNKKDKENLKTVEALRNRISKLQIKKEKLVKELEIWKNKFEKHVTAFELQSAKLKASEELVGKL